MELRSKSSCCHEVRGLEKAGLGKNAAVVSVGFKTVLGVISVTVCVCYRVVLVEITSRIAPRPSLK